jgi:hypothetical protein
VAWNETSNNRAVARLLSLILEDDEAVRALVDDDGPGDAPTP